KAYDTKGVLYRSDEKNMLSLKYVYSEAKTPISVQLNDTEMIRFVRKLFASFVGENNGSSQRKASVEEQIKCFNSVFDKMLIGEASATFDFDYYALCLYILTIYTRFVEAKGLVLEPISSNPMAVDIGHQAECNIPDRFSELLRISELLVVKAIDSDAYEENVRELTDSRAFKLYNLKRILSRAEKQVLVLLDREASDEESTPTFPGAYVFDRTHDIVTLCLVEDDLNVPSSVNNE
ncbi:hypothetical protein PAEPH01_2832, partial [Pancytospora epiphaga]